jgi:serine/threonine-protein kinase
VEGETLRDRIDREKQLPVDEAVRIATAVANALDYAHRHKVIHRDIKPANILLQDGEPVVADFGIALALGVAGGTRLTETGLSVGTPFYMSPEQATGDLAVAASTDTYALGAVLYEMLVGEPPYPGATAQAVLGKIIAGKPVSATEQRPSIPANVDAAVRKALEKLPADRFASVQDFARALGDEHFRYGELVTAGAGAAVGPWKRLTLVGWSLAAAATIVAGWALLRPAPAPPGMVHFAITPPEEAPLNVDSPWNDLAISRDGSLVVYRSGGPPADRQLNLRPLNQLESAPIRGTEGGRAPFFSHDGEWVGFLVGDELRKVSVFGGPPMTLAEALDMEGFSWGADDWIIFGSNAGLFRVPGGGGEPESLTALDPDRNEQFHTTPHRVDGFDLVVFLIWVGIEAEIAVLDLDTREVTRLGIPGRSPRYVSTGHIVFTALDGSIRAVPFDADALEVTDSPVPLLVEGVGVKGNGSANFDISDNGSLVYALGGSAGGGAPPTNLVLVALDGTRAVLAELDDRAISPRFSPEGLRVAYATTTTNGTGPEADLWVLEPARGARTKVTFGGNNRFYPIWTRDGTRLVHADAPDNQNRLLSTPADGSGGSDTLLALGDRRFPTSWSPDGRTLAYYVGPAGTPTNSRDHLDASRGRGRGDTGAFRRDAVHGAGRHLFAERALGSLCVRQVWAERRIRPTVPGTRRGSHDLGARRRRTRVGAVRERAVLP